MSNFNDKVVLVTGGASGIGAEIVRAVLDKGPKHVAVLDINEELGKALEEELNSKYGVEKAKFRQCDVTKDLDAAFEEIVNNFGYIDVVINNAGILNDAPNFYEKQILINVVDCTDNEFAESNIMHKQQGGKGGTIINISSTLGLMQMNVLPVYSATKSAVLQFSNCLGMNPNYERSGVRVVTICFGPTDTNLIRGQTGVIDSAIDEDVAVALANSVVQTADVAARGVIEAYEKGASASTWLITNGRPAEDITVNVKTAYEILAKGVY